MNLIDIEMIRFLDNFLKQLEKFHQFQELVVERIFSGHVQLVTHFSCFVRQETIFRIPVNEIPYT